jgi:hypothetical protein
MNAPALASAPAHPSDGTVGADVSTITATSTASIHAATGVNIPNSQITTSTTLTHCQHVTTYTSKQSSVSGKSLKTFGLYCKYF